MFDIWHSCGTCKHAKWHDQTKGWKLRNSAGECLAPTLTEDVLKLVPDGVEFCRSDIRQDNGENCYFYTPTKRLIMYARQNKED